MIGAGTWVKTKDFERRLKKLNSKIRLVPGKLEGSGVYLYQPRHPESHKGLTYVAGYPSPKYFRKIPQWNFRTYEFLTSEGDPRIVHGWNEVIHELVGKGVCGSGKAKSVFPEYRERINSYSTTQTGVKHRKIDGHHDFWIDDTILEMNKKRESPVRPY